MKVEVQHLRRAHNRVSQQIDRNPINMMHQAAAAASPRRNNQQQRNQHLSPERQAANATTNATLHPSPRTLQPLWQEYLQGLGGRKAAKDFTREERGRCKFKYSRRKIVWDAIAAQVRAGRLATDVIDSIYSHYGGLSVTAIINRLRDDKKNNRLPANLCF